MPAQMQGEASAAPGGGLVSTGGNERHLRELERTLGLRDLTFIVVGTVIGSGIFIVPATVLRQTGTALGPALLVWLAGGVLSLLGALTYGELGAANPRAGGLYDYVREAFGRLPAFLYGWTLFFAIGSGSVATLAVAAASYAQQVAPIGPAAARLIAPALIVLVAAINVRGTRHGAGVQTWATLVKVGAIVAMSAALMLAGGPVGHPPETSFWPAGSPAGLVQGAGLAMVGVLWAYEGWQYVTFSAGETVEPQRTFPRAIVLGTALLVGLYLLANVAYVAALGAPAAAASERVAADAVAAAFGSEAASVIAAAIVVSMFGAANGVTLTASRAYYQMARDGLFFRRLGEIHPRFGTPALSVAASSAWAMALAATGTFEQLLTYVVFVGWIFYALGAGAVFVLRRRRPDAERPFRVPGYPWTPALFVAASAAIVLNTLATRPYEALAGLGVVALGAPAFLVWRARALPGGGRQASLVLDVRQGDTPRDA
jgi:APA family basic amino acid/polyamine antiporter